MGFVKKRSRLRLISLSEVDAAAMTAIRQVFQCSNVIDFSSRLVFTEKLLVVVIMIDVKISEKLCKTIELLKVIQKKPQC